MPDNNKLLIVSPGNGDYGRFWWLIPVVVAVAVYGVSFNNYFTFDDFIWLDRARTFRQDWLQIFRPDVAYFDPLVHLMFLADSLVSGLDHRWCHAVDLAIHAVNSLLVYRLARLLGGDERASLYGGALFAGSFAIADAVLWSSSRVDLLSTFFSLLALIQFLRYLRYGTKRSLPFSVLLFVLALGAKGTPLVLPVILFWLVVQEKKPLGYATRLIPFGGIVILYVALVKLTEHLATLPLDKLHFNVRNMVLSFDTLFVPEGTLANLNLTATTVLLFIAVSALCLPVAPLKTAVALRRTGYCILLSALVPVLITTDFNLATRESTIGNLLVSPSHRIYLASVGAALLGGGILRSGEILLNSLFPRFALAAAVLTLTGGLAVDVALVRERNQLWRSEGEKTRAVVDFLRAYPQRVGEGSQIGLIKFPGSRVFMEPVMRGCLGVRDATFMDDVTIGMLEDPAILNKAEKSFLFVFGRDGQVYDKSREFRQHLLLSRKARLDFSRLDNVEAAQRVTQQLIQEINTLL